jgi:hypothetical protein
VHPRVLPVLLGRTPHLEHRRALLAPLEDILPSLGQRSAVTAPTINMQTRPVHQAACPALLGHPTRMERHRRACLALLENTPLSLEICATSVL